MFITAVLCAGPGFSQNLAAARTVHAMSGRVIHAVHISAPTASRYVNFLVSSFSSGFRGQSAFESVGTPDAAGILVALLTSNLFIVDSTYKY